MNSTKHQALLLIVLMTFLSIVTVFLLQASPEDSTQTEVNNTVDTGLSDIEIEKPEGDGVVSQIIRGWISLYRDFNSSMEIFSNSENTE